MDQVRIAVGGKPSSEDRKADVARGLENHIPTAPRSLSRMINHPTLFFIELRQIKYPNNIVEQEHRATKQIARPRFGFKRFRCAHSYRQHRDYAYAQGGAALLPRGERLVHRKPILCLALQPPAPCANSLDRAPLLQHNRTGSGSIEE